MPELPEVETIRQDLRRKILNTKIVKVEVRASNAVGGERAKFGRTLTGNAIREIERRGKLMVWRLERGDADLLVHLKMTGQLIYERQTDDHVEVVAGGHKLTERDFDLPNAHTRVIFTFANRGKLFFNDLRRFGYLKLASAAEAERALSKFGIEPLTKAFTGPAFRQALGKRQTSVKAALMDQEKIAGIGNIYADEICFCARVRPTRRVSTLTIAEKKKLFACTPRIIQKAIQHKGTTFRDYLDTEGKQGNYTNFLRVYDQDGKPCSRCHALIKKIKSNGRGTHFCPHCQK
ncbi:MAG: bifunctional DNA-formamidopyrimidine glycosylase/DNA-(apurinic or apyrimidinic site) lyase [Candidatus Magasanikbacteria bacterium]|nr:bifunctional DNA-formamidopyrimidine glycosylase/DNA-(apurinic or apyrimidinic site) lyase [Candidatus Magasanikbacteria bacterium]